MVEGENDSFDTSIIPEDLLLDEDINLSSGPSQLSNLSNLSQLSSPSQQGGDNWSIGGSQDNNTIQDFIRKADNERVIMMSPFEPSVPGAPRRSPRTRGSDEQASRSPDPEFHMPRVDVDSPRRATSVGSSRTITPKTAGSSVRQRRSGAKRQAAPRSIFAERQPEEIKQRSGARPTVAERMATSLPQAFFEIIAWSLSVVGMALQYAKKPIAIALALYVAFGLLLLASNFLMHSVYTALSPMCNIPGINYVVDLPFCPSVPGSDGSNSGQAVQFDGLMKTEEAFEEVLEKAANGVSLPMEMQRTETSVREVRNMVRWSQLQAKEELGTLLDDFMGSIRPASDGIQSFNIHVGAAVDSVIQINRYTTRYLDGLAAAEKEGRGLIADVFARVFAPFQPAVFSDSYVLDKYVEHTSFVAEKIQDLIDEATELLRLLKVSEDKMHLIGEFTMREMIGVKGARDTGGDIWERILYMVGVSSDRMRGLQAQLVLLKRVDADHKKAVDQVKSLLSDLHNIQDELKLLHAAARGPATLEAMGAGGGRGAAFLPIELHIETINDGVERLERARRRIRAVEDDRIREVLARGKDAGRFIDSS